MDGNYTRYNIFMNSTTAQRLLTINRMFYEQFGISFSASRQRLQPGVLKVIESFQRDERILDLGCGNGLLAATLSGSGHRGAYLGLDASAALLNEARKLSKGTSAEFIHVDLTGPLPVSAQISTARSASHQEAGWALILAFAVLHHIPSIALRLTILKDIRSLMAPNGRFIHSNWQFLSSEKLRSRIQPWETAGLSAAEVEENDYLLDWRRAGTGLRYVHHFSEPELNSLAVNSGFRVRDSFYSDGEGGKLGLYQVWETSIQSEC